MRRRPHLSHSQPVPIAIPYPALWDEGRAERTFLSETRMDANDVLRVTATPAALDLIDALKAEYGEILFHQSGGCCDGSAPMCFPVADYMVGDRDVRLGPIGGAQVYINREQYEYWKHTQLIIDVVPGRGGMFSLENGKGKRFLTRGRVFTDAEVAALAPV